MTTHAEFAEALRAQRVWDRELPGFDADAAPAEPLTLFHSWFLGAVAARQVEPHTMTLATVDADGLPDVRTLMLHDADARGWHFATHATSAKGQQLAARPFAALHFYWPAVAQQIRIRGRVSADGPGAVRSRGALAAALTGHQSEILDTRETLVRASAAAWERAGAEPDATVPTWTAYTLTPDEVEFFQGDAMRRHVRLRYRRQVDEDGISTGTGTNSRWDRELLWP
ncbi:pyridoxal 5'-phosphate synthase [Streptomyces sp. NPDC048603]|uniref:pyridoxine/pyridoxamine 5'-phosphate oxidase n=1 Tax=Streptomyces sp. NPDC048603 TaxID=3365577 RepID=UPI00371092E9